MSDADHPGQGQQVDDVLITPELARRPSRAPDYEAESRALGLLAQEMATNPDGVLQKCAELVMELCHADSAGVSVLEPGDASSVFRWEAAVGAFAPNLGGIIPQEASPCGIVVDRNSVLLFNEAERFFPDMRGVEPRIYESLLAPWHVNGEAVGTLWAIKHTPEGRFDAEDARLLQSLSRVASAAYQMASALKEAKATEVTLQHSERRYRTLFEALDEGYGLADVIFDQTGQAVDIAFVEVNPAAVRMVGTDLTGRRLREVDPNYEPYWYEIFGRVARTGQGERLECYAAPDGRWYDFYVFKPEPEDKESRRVAAVFRDVTERNEAETAQRDLLATLDLAVLMTRDLDDTIRFWSEGCERLYGWTATEAVGQSAHDLLCTVFPVPRSEVEAVLERCGMWSGDLRQRTRDGGEVIITARKVLRRDAEGRPVAVVESLVDVTEARRAEQALRESEARLKELQAELLHISRLSVVGEMASALAHELNQPLAAIATYLSTGQLILGSEAGALAPERLAEVRRVVDRAVQQALRVGEIVRRLRKFVAKGEAEKRPEELRKLIEEAGMLSLVGVRGNDIHITFRLDLALPPVLVDRVQIQQVLVNLIRNAVEAMAGEDAHEAPPRREVIITAAPAGPEMVEVSVADTGPGLPPEVVDRLFEPFVSTKPNGMGVGLSICRTIVSMHDGRLWAEPNGEAGTVFRFTVPRAPTDISEGDHP